MTIHYVMLVLNTESELFLSKAPPTTVIGIVHITCEANQTNKLSYKEGTISL